ncbi:MAG: ATP-binding cassette domain-containing protein [Oscillospiraceae bacterium]
MFIEISNIKKSYGSGESKVDVLKGISVGIEKGEFCVLLGPSGSGKSTLLNIIGGIDDADSGYFSNSELTELDNDDVAAVITAMDYTKLSDQLTVSMGGMMDIFKWFGAIFFVIVVYVLCKQVIERNFQSIAMTKILGFRNGEIGGLYIASTTIAVLLGLIISIPFMDVAMRAIFKGYLYTMMTGYIPYVMSPMTYIVTVSVGLVCYAVVALLQMRKVSKISKSEALKNVE